MGIACVPRASLSACVAHYGLVHVFVHVRVHTVCDVIVAEFRHANDMKPGAIHKKVRRRRKTIGGGRVSHRFH